ncbi:unnamed protein product [Closterium sp. Naga37s-1]|nr:unnamed protein product [Closterium sp. Naga37s-1]
MAVPATRRFPHRSPTALLLPLAVLTLAAVSESARLASVSSVVSTFSSPKLVNDSSPSSSSSFSSSSYSSSSSASSFVSLSSASSTVESHDDVAELEDDVSAPRRMMLAPGWMLWRMANSNRCRPSSLQGYTSSRKLGNGLVLHWRATTGKRLRVAVMARAGTEAAAAGWFAVGWSPKGDMDGSNVVAREADSAPIAYDLSGHEDATEARSWVPQDASVEHTGNGIIMRFTRIKGDGSSVGIKTWEGFNYIVFAYGMGITIGDHQYRATATVGADSQTRWLQQQQHRIRAHPLQEKSTEVVPLLELARKRGEQRIEGLAPKEQNDMESWHRTNEFSSQTHLPEPITPYQFPHAHLPIPISPYPSPHTHLPIPISPYPSPHTHLPIPISPYPSPHTHPPIPISPYLPPHTHLPTLTPPYQPPHTHLPTLIPPYPSPHTHPPIPISPRSSPHSHIPPYVVRCSAVVDHTSPPSTHTIYFHTGHYTPTPISIPTSPIPLPSCSGVVDHASPPYAHTI